MPDPCQFIQDEIDNIEQEISDLEDSLGEVPPAVRAALLRQIGRLRQQLRLKSAELQSCEHDPSRYFLQLDGIEVTQAIQDLAHSVPLVAGKRSVVRVYLSYYGSPGVTVHGENTVSRSGSSVTVPSVNVVTLDPALAGTLNPKRNNAALSLNFILPNEQTTPGYLNVSVSRVTNAASGAAIAVMRASTVEVQFQAATTLRVRILGMRYSQGTPPTVFAPTPLDFGLLVSWLPRAYPVTNVVSSQAIIEAAPAIPFGCSDINAQLAAIRALDIGAGTDHRTHYYGMVSDGGFFMRGCAAGIPSTPDPGTVARGQLDPGLRVGTRMVPMATGMVDMNWATPLAVSTRGSAVASRMTIQLILSPMVSSPTQTTHSWVSMLAIPPTHFRWPRCRARIGTTL